MSTQKEKKAMNVDTLIEIEWDIIRDLKKMLRNPQLSSAEKMRTANALAYHASVLNKLLAQKGDDSKFNDATLGDFIRGVEPRIARRVTRDFRRWTRRLSLKK